MLFRSTAQTLVNVYDEVDDGGDVDTITNVRAAVCGSIVNLTLCTDLTLVSGATYISHLWAGDINFSAAGHIILGDDAVIWPPACRGDASAAQPGRLRRRPRSFISRIANASISVMALATTMGQAPSTTP